MNFNEEDIKWLDSSGATQTSSTIELVSDYKSLAKTLELDVDYKAKGDVSIAALKAGASLQLNSKYQDFARDESRTLAIVVKAVSYYGRKGLREYKLKQPFDQYILAGNHEEFRTRCGTHTVVAESRQSMVSAIIMITDLGRTSKTSLENLYKSTFSASGAIEAVKVEASDELTLKWKNIVDTASKLGTMKISFESRGGSGVSDALKIAASNNPEDIKAILTSLTSLGSSFTQSKSAPYEYLLISNSAFGAKIKIADISKLESLNSYFEQLAKIDFALNRITNYKNSFQEIYDRFYKPVLTKINGVRSNLVNAIEQCVLNDDCGYIPPNDLGILYLEDIITADTLTLDCSYTKYDITDTQGKIRSTDVLYGIAVNLKGRIRLADFVSVENAIVARFGPDSQTTKFNPGFLGVSVSQPDQAGNARIAATLDYRGFKPDVVNSGGTIALNNQKEITEGRETLQNSIFSISIQAKNGMSIINTVGPAFGGNCPITRVSLQ
ncbi:hypothetical protein [Nitrosospira sp. Nsp14]|uniref:hypothetical protein n=1 Tax=Nitrosospira sp. Nsp14 TaxID=1855333 RepID=UPI000B893D0A|nr:hypothetical protein [Nitrosospira sp. Nsp14]